LERAERTVASADEEGDAFYEKCGGRKLKTSIAASGQRAAPDIAEGTDVEDGKRGVSDSEGDRDAAERRWVGSRHRGQCSQHLLNRVATPRKIHPPTGYVLTDDGQLTTRSIRS
jgi:hypothetical protein